MPCTANRLNVLTRNENTMKTILFQGDSITDAGRDRARDGYNLGHGYATMVAGHLGSKYPDEYTYKNRAVSGNRIVDLYARIKVDLINLRPDLVSILIGINDVWHEISAQNGVCAEKFFKVYSDLIEEIKEALPDTKIMILEPFVLTGTATAEKLDIFSAETALRAKAAKEVAENNRLVFVPLQDRFNEAVKKAPAEYWLMDGVHPNPAGHGIITDAWLEGFKKLG